MGFFCLWFKAGKKFSSVALSNVTVYDLTLNLHLGNCPNVF